MHDPKIVIHHILDIIGYTKDKDTFADTFFQKCETATVMKLIHDLPENQQKEIEEKIASGKTQSFLDNYVSTETYKKTLSEASELLLTDYLDELASTLTQEQKHQIQSYLATLK